MFGIDWFLNFFELVFESGSIFLSWVQIGWVLLVWHCRGVALSCCRAACLVSFAAHQTTPSRDPLLALIPHPHHLTIQPLKKTLAPPHLARARAADHVDDLRHRRAAHDGVVDEQHAAALEHDGHRVELAAHRHLAHALFVFDGLTALLAVGALLLEGWFVSLLSWVLR